MTKARIVITGLAILLCLCVFSVTAARQSGPVIQSITPDAVPAGGPDAFITVKGSGFNASSVIFDQSGNPIPVRLNGVTQSTLSYTIAPRGSLTLAPRDSNGQSPF